MQRHEYFEKYITGITAKFAYDLAYKMNTQKFCDAAICPGAYKQTLKIAAEIFPEWFLEDRYISEITDPETRKLKGKGAIPFRDWAVSITQVALEGMDKDPKDDADFRGYVDGLIAKYRQERDDDSRKDSFGL